MTAITYMYYYNTSLFDIVFGVSLTLFRIIEYNNVPLTLLKTIAVNKVTNRWRNHNNKTTKISELNKIIELYEL